MVSTVPGPSIESIRSAGEFLTKIFPSLNIFSIKFIYIKVSSVLLWMFLKSALSERLLSNLVFVILQNLPLFKSVASPMSLSVMFVPYTDRVDSL